MKQRYFSCSASQLTSLLAYMLACLHVLTEHKLQLRLMEMSLFLQVLASNKNI